jgi:hypothetical protein
MMFPEPPGSTLSYGGETVEGGLGPTAGSWVGAGVGSDAIAIILGEEPLEAPAGATLSFAYKGKALDSLSVAAHKAHKAHKAHRVGREAGGGGREDEMFLPAPGGGGRKDLPVRRFGTRGRIVTDPPPGKYVLDAFARMPQGDAPGRCSRAMLQGDASYGFRLILEPRDPGGP